MALHVRPQECPPQLLIRNISLERTELSRENLIDHSNLFPALERLVVYEVETYCRLQNHMGVRGHTYATTSESKQ
jgi:hypothetical protein